MKLLTYLLIICLVLSVPGYADTIHVPADHPEIQAAIDAACNGDKVIVAPGTYKENIRFNGKAIQLVGFRGADMTCIDGGMADVAVACEDGEGPNTVLEGFTITRGKSMRGGGMRIRYSCSPTIKNCVFTQNSTSGNGGGIHIHMSEPTILDCVIRNNTGYFGGGISSQGSDPKIRNCIFHKNNGTYGGGMANLLSGPEVTNCTFTENKGQRGGGMYNETNDPVITDCVFIANNASRYGGGVCNRIGSEPILINCTFEQNTAFEYGGGLGAYQSVHTTMINCVFSENFSDLRGGGIGNSGSEVKMINCIVHHNTAGYRGGGLMVYGIEDVIINCTFYGNIAGEEGGGIGWYPDHNYLPSLTNCILRENTPDEILNGAPDVSFSNVKGGYPGQGNMESDPMFVDPENGDFHLCFNSPCINAGSNEALEERFDLEGDPRFHQGIVDIGADEFYDHFYCTGDFIAGGSIEAKFIGEPGNIPTRLIIGSGLYETPRVYPWGLFYIEGPWVLVTLTPIPSNGVLTLPAQLPASPTEPYDIPMQAMINDGFSNPFLLEVR